MNSKVTTMTPPPEIDGKRPSSMRSPRRKLRRRRWVYRQPKSLSSAQETIFYTMAIRKKQRGLNGTHQKTSKRHTIGIFSILLIIYAVGAFSTSFQEGLQLSITIGLHEVIAIGGWMLLAVIVMNALAKSKFIIVLRWALIFWPLVALFSSMFYPEGETRPWIALMFIIGEALTLVLFVGIYYISPWALGSEWFRRNFSDTFVGNLMLLQGGHVKAVSRWTLSYKNILFGNSYTCKYEGQTNAEGMPHGQGRWLDDSYRGEIYAGMFDNGKPVAPFVSREYGTGNTLSAVRIAYFMATDDSFTSHKINPSNNLSPRCGVASVECSIHGSFYYNLPEASKIYGPHFIGDADGSGGFASIRECCRRLIHMEESGWRNFIGVTTADDNTRGRVMVLGHVFEPTGLPFSDDVDQIIIDVNRLGESPSASEDADFMPITQDASWKELFGKNEEDKDSSRVLVPVDEPLSPISSDSESQISSEFTNRVGNGAQMPAELRKRRTNCENNATNGSIQAGYDSPHVWLDVRDWSHNTYKEALIYFPGFNQGLKASLETLGQFIAMTKLSAHVYPVVYSWPAGQANPKSYHMASEKATSERNKEHFASLLDGLRQSGVKNVHVMSHSMGSQPLLSVFDNNVDGTRSETSLKFRLDPAFLPSDTEIFVTGENRIEEDTLLVCKSITLINPDYPLEAFVDHSFVSIRRICSHITVIGDRNDKALWWSELLGGLSKSLGYKQPTVLNGSRAETTSFCFQEVLGREIHKLHHSTPQHADVSFRILDASERTINNAPSLDEEIIGGYASYDEYIDDIDERFLFQSAPPQGPLGVPGFVQQSWLDIDVIDTTNLDTNMQRIRHSAFNINAAICRDLEELIVTGRRAARRSALLHREGNMYSYCVAPRYVVM